VQAAEQVERNRVLQSELYGEPLGELLRRIAAALGLTQARMAEVIGLSAPMLSQLISAQRVKIGNPAVVRRIQALDELAAVPGLSPAELARRIDQVRGSTGLITRTTAAAPPAGAGPRPAESRDVVHGIQDVFRATASAEELLAAAALLDERHPRIAELIRLYGTGRTADAVESYRRTVGPA
jgi:transcriptional regulator with XRE-family HTH domain